MLPDQDTISVLRHLGLPDDNIFMIDNTSFEEIDIHTIIKTIPNYSIAIKRAILDQERSFNYNKQNVNILLNGLKKFDSFDVSLIQPIYTVNEKLLTSIETFINCKNKLATNIYPQMTRLNEKLDNATSKSIEYSDYKTITSFKYQDFEIRDNECRTICSRCENNELYSCHNPCNCTPFGTNIRKCNIFAGNGLFRDRLCRVCNHGVRYHCHSKQFPIMIEKKEEKYDENRKIIFDETQNEIRKLQHDIKKYKKSRLNLKESLLHQLTNMTQLTYDLKKYNPLKYYNDEIHEYIDQCINAISKDDIDMKSTAVDEHLKKIEEYRRVSKLYSIKNDFCIFWDTFLSQSKVQKVNNDRNKEIIDCVWTMLKKFNGSFNTANVDSCIDINGIMDVFQVFSQKWFFSFGEDYKYDGCDDAKDEGSLALAWLKQWNHFWKIDNVNRKQFEIICRLMQHFYIGSSHREMVYDDKKNLFDHITFGKKIVKCIRWLRDEIDENNEQVVESNKNNDIGQAVNVEYRLFFLVFFYYCVCF